MSITPEQERGFYDAVYSPFLNRPATELAVNREVMLRTMNDPTQAAYERRRLYLRILDRLSALQLRDSHVLDYGCGPAEWGVWMATEGARVTLLDLSPAAIELGLKRAAASGVGDLVRGEARDASNLSCFADGEFDLIYASAALHHTLKYAGATEELVRVLKPGGVLVLAETLGNNPLLNLGRRMRARVQGEAEEQGEEIILSEAEIAVLRKNFREVHTEEMNLFAMGKRLLRGRFGSAWARRCLRLLEGLDDVVLYTMPRLKRYCGEVVIVAVK